jgi:MFS family permease
VEIFMTRLAKENVIQIGREITEEQQRWGFRFIVLSAMISVIGATTFAGDILTMVALNLGGEEGYVGFLRFLVLTASVAQILVVRLAQRVSKKKFLLTVFTINILITAPILAVQWIGSTCGQATALTVLALIVGSRSVVLSINIPSWMGMLREMLSEQKQGRLLGIFRTSWQSTLALTLLLVGFYLGRHPNANQLQVVLMAGVVAELCRMLVLIPVPSVPVRLSSHVSSWWETIQKPLGDPNYRYFLKYTAFYSLAMGLADGFRIVYLWRLGFGQNMALISASLTALGAVLTLLFWGKLADRFGNRNVFSLTLAGFAGCTLLWLTVRPTTLGLILSMLLFFGAGAFHAGNGIVHTRYMFANLKSELDASYIAVTYLAMQLTMGIGSLIGGQLLRFMDAKGLGVGQMAVNNYHIVFFVSFLAFLVPWFLRRKLREPTEKPTREVVAIVLQPIRQLFGSFLLRSRNDQNQEK